MEEILKALPGGVALAIFVLDEEILRSNLQPFIEQGLIRVVSPDTEVEENAFVNFAVELDDGEAVTGAIAMHRYWGIATDDRKARRIFARTSPHVQLLSTPELIKHWADTHKPPIEVVREVLQNIQTHAMNATIAVRGSFRHKHEGKQWLVDRSLIPTLPRIELGQRLSPELLLLFPDHENTHTSLHSFREPVSAHNAKDQPRLGAGATQERGESFSTSSPRSHQLFVGCPILLC